MSNFEDAFMQTEMYKNLSQDKVHGSTLMLRHYEANGKDFYLNPFTRLAEEMFNLGYEAGKEGEPLKPAYFDPTYPPSDIGMNAFGKPVPQERCEEGYNFLIETIGKNHTKVELEHYMALAVRAVEKDKAAEFMEHMNNILDVTGCYRLLAILCSGRTRPDPTPLGNKKDAIVYVETKPPYFFSQLRRGMAVQFKDGSTARIRDLAPPDDEGQAFYGISFDRTPNSPQDLTTGYHYAFGDYALISGECDNVPELSIDKIRIPKDDLKKNLNISLTWNANQREFGEPPQDSVQSYIYFGHQRRVDENKELFYCRVQFHRDLKRESLVLQQYNPIDLLKELEDNLGLFFGVQEVCVGVHIDMMRKDLDEYLKALSYGVPSLFIGI